MYTWYTTRRIVYTRTGILKQQACGLQVTEACDGHQSEQADIAT